MRSRIVRVLAVASAFVALAVPSGGQAGTAIDPEITDPAGDVQWLPDGSLSYMDLRSAWFDSVRGDDESLQGFRVHIRNEAPRAADQPLLLWASWKIAAERQCTGQLEIHDTDTQSPTGLLEWTASADISSWCEGDSSVISIGPITVVIFPESREVTFGRDGIDYVATIPLAAFDGTTADGLYKEGATLLEPFVTTFKVLPIGAAIGVDYNETARNFVLGS